MRSRMTRTAVVALCLVTATSCFEGKKPEPERNCSHTGRMLVCPPSIQAIQNDAECVTDGRKLRMHTTLKKIKSGDKTSLSKVKVDISSVGDDAFGDVFEVKLTAPDGTVGYVKVFPCDYNGALFSSQSDSK